MIINFLSSVWIIWSTKICFSLGFHYATALTALHFLFTYIGLELAAMAGVFERKPLSISGVLPLSIAFCGFIVFNNLSLQYNTIGIYQVTKVLTTPLIVVIQLTWYGKWLSVWETLCLVFVCVGVVVATETNLAMTLAGLVSGILGVVSSSIYQIWVETKQHDFSCSPAQLLYYQAPISFCLLVPVMLFSEPVTEIITYPYSWKLGLGILGSSLLAFLVNLSTYIVIGKTSPVTYNMVGHSKLVVIILSSYMFFGEKQSIAGMVGVMLAVVGIIGYAHVRMTARENAREPKIQLPELHENKPLIDSFSTKSTSDDDV
jgi:solute carrier family 35, member E3